MLNGLTPTAGEPLPFADTLLIRAFTLANGLVVYSAPGVSGPARGQYLNHWHEAKFGGGGFAEAPLYVHAGDSPWVDRPHTTFTDGTVDGDFELIPIPGHTPGATAFLWQGALFTGDSLYYERGEWRAAMLDSSDRAAYVASLERLRDVEFDHLVPWAAPADEPWHTPNDPAQLEAVIERLRRGEDR